MDCRLQKNLRKVGAKRLRASYTVEASVIVPLVIWAMAFAMKEGIRMYQEIEGQQEQICRANMWEVEEFYTIQAVKEGFND